MFKILKFLKYDLKGDYKKILGTIIAMIVFDLILITLPYSSKLGKESAIGLIIFLNNAAIVAEVIIGVSLLYKYTSKSRGYLFFTVPQPGYKILASRIISALIEIIVVTAAAVIMCILSGVKFYGYNNVVSGVKKSGFTFTILLEIIISCIIIYSIFLNVVYFSIILSKTAFRNKKTGDIGAFIIFIIISVLSSFLQYKLDKTLPARIDIGEAGVKFNINGSIMRGTGIAGIIFQVILFIVLFVTSARLIDRKMDI